MRLLEVGIKRGGAGDRKAAMDCFSDALDAYALFWFLREAGKK